jgi:hypothetical protein
MRPLPTSARHASAGALVRAEKPTNFILQNCCSHIAVAGIGITLSWRELASHQNCTASPGNPAYKTIAQKALYCTLYIRNTAADHEMTQGCSNLAM